MTMKHKYNVGERVLYRGTWGNGKLTLATIKGIGEERGKVVYDLSDGHWAYEAQISAVFLRA